VSVWRSAVGDGSRGLEELASPSTPLRFLECFLVEAEAEAGPGVARVSGSAIVGGSRVLEEVTKGLLLKRIVTFAHGPFTEFAFTYLSFSFFSMLTKIAA